MIHKKKKKTSPYQRQNKIESLRKNISKNKWIFIIIIGILVLQIGIGLSLPLESLRMNSNPATQPKGSQPSQPNSNGEYRIGVQNPLRLEETNLLSLNFPENFIIGQVYEGLFQYNLSDPSMEIIPCLASDFGIWDENRLQYKVKLNPEIKVHNDLPVTATDVKWNFDRRILWYKNLESDHPLEDLMHPEGKNNSDHAGMFQSVDIEGSDTVIFNLNYPCPYFEDLLCHTSFSILFPDEALEENIIQITDMIPAGTGPYIISKINSSSCNLAASDTYWAKVPDFNEIVLTYFNQTSELLSQLLDKSIDFAPYFNLNLIKASNATIAAQFVDHPEIVTRTHPRAVKIYLTLNQDKLDPVITQAIQHALNYSTLLEAWNFQSPEYYTPSQSLYPFFLPTTELSENLITTNLTYARKLLIEAGSTSQLDLLDDQVWIDVAQGSNPIATITFTNLPFTNISLNSERVAYLQECFAHLGIKLEIINMGSSFTEWNEYYNSIAVQWEYGESYIIDPTPGTTTLLKHLQKAPVKFSNASLLNDFHQISLDSNTTSRNAQLSFFQNDIQNSSPICIPLAKLNTIHSFNVERGELILNPLMRFKLGVFSFTKVSSTSTSIPGYDGIIGISGISAIIVAIGISLNVHRWKFKSGDQ